MINSAKKINFGGSRLRETEQPSAECSVDMVNGGEVFGQDDLQ